MYVLPFHLQYDQAPWSSARYLMLFLSPESRKITEYSFIPQEILRKILFLYIVGNSVKLFKYFLSILSVAFHGLEKKSTIFHQWGIKEQTYWKDGR